MLKRTRVLLLRRCALPLVRTPLRLRLALRIQVPPLGQLVLQKRGTALGGWEAEFRSPR